MVLLSPFLIDAVSGSIPLDAWDWNSTPVNWIANPHVSRDQNPDPTSYITYDPSGSKRGYAVLEILTTERTYQHDLTIIKEVCQRKLREIGILSEYAMGSIFDGMDELYKLHLEILTKMEDICSPDNWNPASSKISEVFLQNKELLENYYVRYINNRQLSEETLIECQNTNENFKNFLIQCTKNRETKFTDLKELLLRPFQRLTRYP
ncbi:hypothetical protein HDU98_004711, partial [Podochytrium sp. JEL0797]